MPATCCMNVGDTGFVPCDAPAVVWYSHNEDVCSYCEKHDYACGELIERKKTMNNAHKTYDNAAPVNQKVLTLVDEIRAAAETDVPMDAFKVRAAAMTDVERIQLWSRVTKEGLSMQAVKRVHVALSAVVMDVFGVPMGEAGVGVKPKVSAAVADFYQTTDRHWEQRKHWFDPKDE